MKLLFLLIVFSLLHCSEGEGESSPTDPSGNDESDTSHDSDTATDANTDTTTDTDTDTITDTNTDTNTNIDTDTGSDLEPVDPEILLDKVFILDFKPTDWTEPAAIAAEVGAYIPRLLIQIKTVDNNNFEILTGTVTEENTQDMCQETRLMRGYLNQNPEFRMLSSDLPTIIKEGDLVVAATIYNLSWSGTFAALGTQIQDTVAAAILDVREIYELLDTSPEVTPDSVCENLAASKTPCEACLTDYLDYCLWLRAQDFVVQYLPDTEVIDVSEDIIDESCYESQ